MLADANIVTDIQCVGIANPDEQSTCMEYEFLCDYRIENPDIQCVGIANPDEHYFISRFAEELP